MTAWMKPLLFASLALVGSQLGLAAEPATHDENSEAQKQESLKRQATMDSAYSDLLKTPSPKRRKAFLDAVRTCLWDQSKEVSCRAVALLKAWPDYYSRQELSDFVHEYGKLSWKRQDPHRNAFQAATLALLSIDLRGHFDLVDEDDVHYALRKPEERVSFLRAAYWTHRGDGEITCWALKNLAVINHPSAHDLLVILRGDLKTQAEAKAGSYFWCTVVPAAVDRSMRFQERLPKAKSLPTAVESGLKEGETSDEARFIVDLLTSTEFEAAQEELLTVLKSAIKHHQDRVKEFGDGTAKAAAHQAIAEYLERAYITLPQRPQKAK